MKKVILFFTLLFVTGAIFARDESPLLARVTVYWASGGKGSDRYTRQHKCATGVRLQSGHCAVDPRHIPYGSKVILPDGSNLAAVDTGSAVRNRKAARKLGRTPNERNAVVVDRFFETKRQALAWASTHPAFMSIRVVGPNEAALQSRQQPQMKSNVALSSAVPTVKQPVVNDRLLARNDPIARNPLNKLGR